MRGACVVAAIAAGVSILTLPVLAQDLVYKPINPSFGGDPFYSSHLLGIAEIDRPDPPQDDLFGPGGDGGLTQADFFVRQLESRILSRLSQDITDKIFGPDADASGEFRFQGTTIAFETLLDGTVFIRIIDTANGGETTIEVPAFLTAAQ